MTTITGGEKHAVIFPVEIFPPKSGVRTLLEVDPESVIEVHKPHLDTSIRYEYPSENL